MPVIWACPAPGRVTGRHPNRDRGLAGSVDGGAALVARAWPAVGDRLIGKVEGKGRLVQIEESAIKLSGPRNPSNPGNFDVAKLLFFRKVMTRVLSSESPIRRQTPWS